MYLELHILQNFAPNCLNRDDTNSPKDCVFGGYRRARISSQCLKRAVGTYFRDSGLLPDDDLARRTKRIIQHAGQRLASQHGRDEATAQAKVAAALSSQGLTRDQKKPDETQYLLFLGEREIQALVTVVDEHWDVIEATPENGEGTEEQQADGKGKGRKAKKAKKQSDAPREVKDAVLAILDGGRAADLALFGRMLADLPAKNIDAASQVAHAISTNTVAMEMDYFTAVDDLKNRAEEGEDAGASMLGTVEFNSACYYRYANLHLPQLLENLGGDAELARKTIAAFLTASVKAVPTGKQNSFAAHNPPSLVFAVVRDDAPWSLANAFARPVEARYHGGDLIGQSVRRLDHHWNKLCAAYGDEGIRSRAVLLLHDSLTDDAESSAAEAVTPLSHLAGATVDSLSRLIDQTLEAVQFEATEGVTA